VEEKYIYRYKYLNDIRRSMDLKITKEWQNQEGEL